MSKMALHEPFGHLQHKLWLKKKLGVKLAAWLPTTKSQESTWSRCVQVECDTLLEISQGELQVCFRFRPNQRLGREVMNVQSLGSPNRKEVPFGCKCGGEAQIILYGRRWWLPPSPNHGESGESKVARTLSQHQECAEWISTTLWLVWCRFK
jgi:hypothetical protein